MVKRQVAFVESKGAGEETLARLERNLDEPVNGVFLFQLAVARGNEAAAEQALETMDEPVRKARARAGFATRFGSIDEQISAERAVAAADSRLATPSLQRVARLHDEVGQVDEALAAADEVIERSPGDPSAYGLYATIAAGAGRYEAAVDRLREAIRVVDDGTPLRLQMAELLQAQARNDEAAEILQEAFEREESEGRRFDVFRRQIELAMVSGTVDDLIASLRERQSREEGGARYGAYLAEIFILQNDYLAAREELARSLGQNPDDAVALRKLIELSERGGDVEETLRLTKRLSEVDPSAENRADYVARLLESGETDDVLPMIAAARSEILGDPSEWGGVIAAMRGAGLNDDYDALIEDIAVAAGDDPENLLELAKLRLAQLDFVAAEKILWQIAEDGGLAKSLDEVLSAMPKTNVLPYQVNRVWMRSRVISQLNQEVQNSLQQLFQAPNGRRRIFRRSFNPYGVATSGLDVAARARLQAILLLGHLARVQSWEEKFSERLEQVMRSENVAVVDQIPVFLSTQSMDAIERLVRRQAEASDPDPVADEMIASMYPAESEGLEESVKKIRERAERSDPALEFSRLTSELMKDLTPSLTRGEPMDPEKAEEAIAKVSELRKHPALGENPALVAQLANAAAVAGDFDLALTLYDGLGENLDSGELKLQMNRKAIEDQMARMRMTVVARMMVAGDERADEEFAKGLTVLAGMPMGGRATHYSGMRGQVSPLSMAGEELVVGDEEFSFPIYTSLNQIAQSVGGEDALDQWFSERASASELTPATVGVFYSEWVDGEKAAAIERIASVHEQNPTPRSAALLLEANERLGQAREALAVIDLAELQEGETVEVRSLRKLRLLRTAGELDAARAVGERMVRTRVSTGIRDQLLAELSSLGVPPQNLQRLQSRSSSRRNTPNRSQILSKQIQRLLDADKAGEAEKIARDQLAQLLPGSDDYQTINARQEMLRQLKSMKRLDAVRSELRAELDADPGDIDAALRVAEADGVENREEAAKALVAVVTAHPDRVDEAGPVFRQLQRFGGNEKFVAQVVCALLEENPESVFGPGFQPSELLNYLRDPELGERAAKALAGIDRAEYDRLMWGTRLTNATNEIQMLMQVATLGGNSPAAAELLERASEGARAQRQTDMVYQVGLRLAEVQTELGRKEAAKATMMAMIEPDEGVAQPFGARGFELINFLMNSIRNRQNAAGSGPIEQLAELSQRTGTTEALLTRLDEQMKDRPGFSPALLVRSALGVAGTAAEWQEAAKQPGVFDNYGGMQLAATAIAALAAGPNGDETVPKFLSSLPKQFQNGGGDESLRVLVEVLPTLEPLNDREEVGNFIRSLVASAMAEQRFANYYVHSGEYQSSIRGLLKLGYAPEARRLFDFTASERAQPGRGHNEELRDLEARLLAAEGDVERVEITAIAELSSAVEGVGVRWQMAPAIDSAAASQDSIAAAWDLEAMSVPAEARPKSLKVLAGPNPAMLEPVASVSKPDAEGRVVVDLPGAVGLLQVRWVGADGVTRAGPLSAYVVGKNLVEEPVNDSNRNALRQVSGPLGEQSARAFDGESMISEVRVPLVLGLEVQADADEAFVVNVWVARSGSYGSPPRFEVTWTDGTGKESDWSESTRSGRQGEWMQIARVWAAKNSNRNVPEESQKLDLELRLNSGRSYNSTYEIVGRWDGVQLVRVPVSELIPEIGEMVAEARKLAGDGKDGEAVDAYLSAIRLNPEDGLRQNGGQIFETFKKAKRLEELFDLLAQISLYLPNPWDGNQVTMRNETLLTLLVEEALSEDGSSAAKRWLAAVKDGPLDRQQRYLVDAAVTLEAARNDSAVLAPGRVLEFLGFAGEKPDERRMQMIWSGGHRSTLRDPGSDGARGGRGSGGGGIAQDRAAPAVSIGPSISGSVVVGVGRSEGGDPTLAGVRGHATEREFGQLPGRRG